MVSGSMIETYRKLCKAVSTMIDKTVPTPVYQGPWVTLQPVQNMFQKDLRHTL